MKEVEWKVWDKVKTNDNWFAIISYYNVDDNTFLVWLARYSAEELSKPSTLEELKYFKI